MTLRMPGYADANTLVELLQQRAQQQPQRDIYTFLLNGDADARRMTLGALDLQARAIAAQLQQLDSSGARAVLLYPPGLDYIAAFFGCLYAGVIAVPAYPPPAKRPPQRLRAILADSQATIALTTTPILDTLLPRFAEAPDLQRLHWLTSDALPNDAAAAWQPPALAAATLAFLQYTSGSTATPKGVMLTHGNLLHNLHVIHSCFGHSPQSQGVIWLPPYHDMGLIGGILQPLYGNFPVTLMAPVAFLQRPLRWLQAITEYGGTTSGGPNFAYELCVRKITPEQRARLDLSRWEVAFTGAEPVRAETLDRFAATFAECGFRREAFYPCYGLAEATLIVAGGTRSAPPLVRAVDGAALEHHQVRPVAPGQAGSRMLVSSGRSLDDQEIVIAEPQTGQPCAAGVVGEIWVRGPSVAQGYWDRPEATAETFAARLAGSDSERYLRTGDLGVLLDGELYVTGRLKDLIIIRGRNHYPQDLELTVEQSHPAFQISAGAAFAVEIDGEEQLVVVQEVERRQRGTDPQLLADAARAAVAAQHDVQVYAVVLLKPGTIPKTSSGKIQRHACRAAFLDGTLEPLGSSVLRDQPPAPIGIALSRMQLDALPAAERQAALEAYLTQRISQALRIAPERILPEQPLSTLGLDSLSIVELTTQIETELDVIVAMADVLAGPSVAELAAAILTQLAAVTAQPAQPAALLDAHSPYPLSYGQRALWFLHQLTPDSAAYHLAGAVRLNDDLDQDRLRSAVQCLVARHPALRTTFVQLSGELYQQAQPQIELDLTIADAAAWSDLELHERLLTVVQQPFDLQHGPLLRVRLVTQPGHRPILLLVIHHIVSDFWSLAVLLDELSQLYSADTATGLAPLPTTYADYVEWQRAMLDSQGEHHWAYWQRQLQGVPTVLNLPTDLPRPPVQTYRGAAHTRMLGAALTRQLKTVSEQRGLTLYMTLLAAFEVLLYRHTGQPSFLIGTTTAGRSRARFAPLIGYFVNPVALRADLEPTMSFSALLEQTRRTVLDAFAHQDYPFALLVERLQPERDPARPPLFQVMFSLQQAPRLDGHSLAGLALGLPDVQLQLGALAAESIGLEQRTAQFDLTLAMAETADGLGAVIQYNSDLFRSATIERMLGHLDTLLAALVVQPDQPIARLALLSDAERRQLLVTWNTTRTVYPHQYCLHEQVAAQAIRTPESVAVTYADGSGGTQQLCYRDLDERANRLARYLRRLGVGGPGRAETRIGLCVERSVDLVVGLLGILKAGGAYVPVDPDYPAERIGYVLADARAPILLTQHRLVNALRDTLQQTALPIQHTICLDTDWEQIAQEPPTAPVSGARPESLAYVIYTSGSTGRPKGVQISHRSVVNFLHSMRQQPGLSAEDVVVAVTTIAFDIAALEIFLPLIVGARLVLASRATAVDGTRLAALLEHSGATVLQATPATWRLLLATGWHGMPRLRMLCGGEAFPPDLAQQLQPLGAALWNMYGPTETTVWSAVQRVDQVAGLTPIGRPIGNTQLYVLSAQQEPVPIGAVGELYIGGDGVARGYSNQPALTAERFVPDPWSDEPGARLYRTGDLGRWRADGTLECLGRIDQQVKLRGYRIELGEIEAVLTEHPIVHSAAVVVAGVGAAQRLVAYVVPDTTAAPTAVGQPAPAELRSFLRQTLPEYMLPSAFVTLPALPLTANGKIDRTALPAVTELPAERTASAVPSAGLERMIARLWQDALGLTQVGIHDNFFDLGGHSVLVAQVHRQLQEQLGRELLLIDLFKYPTVSALAAYLRQQPAPSRSDERMTSQPAAQPSDAIAIIGLEGRFPGAPDLATFWRNLQQGVEAISFFSEQQLIDVGIDPALVHDPSYVRARGVLTDSDHFDAQFFGFSPREAELMDPQHRVFLECAWSALEHAGYDSSRYTGRVGVFASVGINTYLLHANQALLGSAAQYQAFIGNDKDFVPTRVSYKLGLRGPSINVQTACSSSLVALHLACQSLRSGESDMALTGGIAISAPSISGYVYEPGGIPSPDGHCRAFDAEAAGTVFGSGVGVVVLKRLQNALRDGDTIYAVVRGSAINNDGAVKIGYTAPSVDGQAEVIRDALAAAQVRPEEISYVEAHGTGTALGDPIEIAALTQTFREGTDQSGYCAIGSVKPSIGHLDTAAGIAGLLKTVLALTHQQIPPSLNYRAPNPRIDFAASPFYVNTELRPWPSDGTPRRAGVSSFGIGGTNAHVIVEEAPALPPSPPAPPWQLLPLSAKTPSALAAATARLAAYFRAHPELDLADVAYTLQRGRQAFAHRRVLVARDHADALVLLDGAEPQRVLTAVADQGSRSVAFLFPGQGAQYVGMGHALYEHAPVFRATVDHCARLLEAHLGLDLRTLLYPTPDQQDDDAAAQLRTTAIAQPALFVIEYALAQLWLSAGVQPSALLGHSLGELVAATLAAVFTLPDALRLVAARGRLMQACPPGALLAVPLAEATLAPLLGPALSLAAVNGPRQCVVAGPEAAIAALAEQLQAQDISARRLPSAHAFHSALLDPAVAAFAQEVARVPRAAPQIPFISNVSGTWITDAEASDPHYWAQQLRQPVRFAAGLSTLLATPDTLLLEVGPGTTLSTLARQQERPQTPLALASLRHAQDQRAERAVLLSAAGQLWLQGVALDWAALHAAPRRRVPLPTYPFERQRFWLTPARQTSAPQPRPGKRPDIGDWLYVPLWKQTVAPESRELETQPRHWLMLADTCGLSSALAARLTQAGHTVTTVTAGTTFNHAAPDTYVIDPRCREHFDELLIALKAAGRMPEQIVHAWAVTPPEHPLPGETIESLGWWSLLFLGQALARQLETAPIQLDVLTSNLHALAGESIVMPEKALVLGPCRVLPQEHPHIRCRSIDVALPAGTAPDDLAELLLAELVVSSAETTVAYRSMQRWVQVFEPLTTVEPPALPTRLTVGGVYLITGGLGGIGLTLAEYLARTVQARLVLVGRTALPPRAEWERWLADPTTPAAVRVKLQRVLALEAAGAEVLVAAADVADRAQLTSVLEQATVRFGAINGVIHAAGVAGGGMIQLKTQEAASAVLRPKVAGTLALHALLAEARLDFFVVCSSINALVGGFGQVDYCAANAFLDAFVNSQAGRGRTAYLSINWDRWPDTGMATAASAELVALAQPPHTSLDHPLLDACIEATADRLVYRSTFSVQTHWVLSEHRVAGRATVPGTTYLEMVRAAFAQHSPNTPAEISDVIFITPLIVADDERRTVLTSLERQDQRWTFHIVSQPDGNRAQQEHVYGSIGPATAPAPPPLDLQAIAARCGPAQSAEAYRAAAQEFVTAGPRWQSLTHAHLGAEEGLAALALHDEFQPDLATLGLHPALLDVATGSIQRLGRGNYLPLAYERLHVYRPLPASIYSYVKYNDAAHGSGETLTCDITITDAQGACLAMMSNFSMKRVGAEMARQIAAGSVEAAPSASRAPTALGRTSAPAEPGILPHEGVAAFARLLSGRRPPQVVVSVQALQTVIERAQTFTSTHIAEQLTTQPLHDRPPIESVYIAPGNELERQIAAIWQRVLGLDSVGIDDNFFELGGTSLAGIQIVAELKKTLNIEISTVSIFEAPTIRALATYLSPERTGQIAFQQGLDRAERKLARKRKK